MRSPVDALDEALSSADRLRRLLGKGSGKQVTTNADRSLVKATCHAWFKNHRPIITHLQGDALFRVVDRAYQDLLEASDRATSRNTYGTSLKILRGNLVRLRSQAVVLDPAPHPSNSPEEPPDFSGLIVDSRMQDILRRRWVETYRCLAAGAFLAATVLMGSLLEALLLARINSLADKSPVFRSKCAPIDSRTRKARPLQEWTLSSFIDVAQDVGLIRRPARDVGVVLRDYRNYIHPEKELTHGVTLDERDANMFWVVFVELSRQVIAS